ncbi:DUF2249 domain-containing protein [Georgenia sp. Z1344]|uniref:DUF2249 domain-containing protein n=1 Tax=Georgenia sp. Z1344 TaxID=3416706 RepID=UPI003CFA3C6B
MKSHVEIGAETTSQGGCACGHHDDGALPELDVQQIPHAVRHGAIFGALGQLRPGGGLVIRATHDPIPLLDQLEQRAPGEYAVSYRERGPEEFVLELRRSREG